MKSRQAIFHKYSDLRLKGFFDTKEFFGKDLIVSHEKVEFIFVIKQCTGRWGNLLYHITCLFLEVN